MKAAAGFVPGETVLVQGATGVAGRLAVKGLDPQTMDEVYQQIVTWTRSGELTFDVEKVPLSDIETAWQRTDLKGRRLVVMP
ncbi:hypothetical protein Acor_75080 [Acrocarpospora corrugata]|uniref:Alcohol dehydrogenase-like C-terminal domain-containing protein n=1 Tax=Acrocarpospora corrugata TaxID=35763 RepID=A0A5M3WB25_9ACTN|nr:hypothetical protein [Acrocarpospora corrugata]GES05440.1 hypothetical protein Acor_75080 [Acrocarpospora corrugata]